MIGRHPHDPEREAASYVSGEIPSTERQRFEAHLLGCDACWREVRGGREGRALAEASREIAPAGLRDSIRAAVSVAPIARRSPKRLILTAAVLLIVIAAAGAITFGSDEEPGPIAAAIAATRTQTLAARGPSERPAPDLSDLGLRLVIGGRVDLAGLPADAFLYRTPGGEVAFLFVSDDPFPVARGATVRATRSGGWSASSDGLTLVCGDHPANYLVVAPDPSLVGLVEHAFTSGLSTV